MIHSMLWWVFIDLTENLQLIWVLGHKFLVFLIMHCLLKDVLQILHNDSREVSGGSLKRLARHTVVWKLFPM